MVSVKCQMQSRCTSNHISLPRGSQDSGHLDTLICMSPHRGGEAETLHTLLVSVERLSLSEYKCTLPFVQPLNARIRMKTFFCSLVIVAEGRKPLSVHQTGPR